MSYRAPVTELRFVLDKLLDAGRLAETERFAEATPETVEAILTEAARLAEDVLAPLRRAGDLTPARLENGVVRCTPGFAEAYRALAERSPEPDLRRFLRAVIQAEQHGVSVARVLTTQAQEMRVKRRQRAEEKAMKIPVKVVFPLILTILPVLIIVVIGPGVINIIDAFSN